ncbi:MAG: tetratricopeptide repeat protein [Planctomycetes bacterium]|nr:tetratricopeptide repeat protein [Planctomycetota bacterium]
MSTERAKVGIGLAASACAVLAAFANSLDGAFVLDDLPNLVANTKLAPLWPPTADLWAEPGRGLSGRPVAAFSFALDRALWGLDPRGFRVTNVVIHLLATWALFALVRAVLALPRAPEVLRARRTLVAAAIASVWAAHPLHVTAVTYVVQRCESLMGLFALTSLVCAVRAFRASTARAAGAWTACATLGMLFGAAVKESIAVLPLVLIVLDRGFASESFAEALRKRRRLYAALASVWLAIGLSVFFAGAHRASAAGILPELTWWAWLRSQAAALAHYARSTFWPDPVLIDYGWPIPQELLGWLPAALVVLGAVAFALAGAWRGSRAAVLLLVAFLWLAPTSSVLPIPFELWALHRMYLPLAALVALILGALASRLRPSAALVVVAVVLAGLGAWRTHVANRTFASPEILWTKHVQAREANDRAWFQLGEALRARGDARGALAAYRRAVELHPTYPLWLNNLATLELALGDLDAAIAHYATACALLPEATLERSNLVEALLQRGELARAERELEPLMPRADELPIVRRLAARIFARTGREAAALSAIQRARELAPGDFAALETWVLLRASAVDPLVRDVAAAERLLASLGTPPAARVAELGRLRAVVAAALGRFDEATALGNEALARARLENRPQLAAALERELESHARREPPRAFVR